MSRTTDLIPLILLFVFLGFFGWIGYQMYVYSQTLTSRAQASLEKRNIRYKDGGMKVGVKEMSHEQYSDKTQSYFVKAWNESRWPDYKSRFWNKEAEQPAAAAEKPAAKPSTSRTTSSSSRPTASRSGSAK